MFILDFSAVLRSGVSWFFNEHVHRVRNFSCDSIFSRWVHSKSFLAQNLRKKFYTKLIFFTLKKRNRPQWYHFNIIFTDSRTLKDAKAQNNKRFWQSNFDQYHEQKQSKNDEKDTYQGVNNDWILIRKSFIKIMILTDGCQLHCTKFL